LEAIGSLASGIAHEFNNLLQVIRGYTRFAMDELSVDAQPYRDLQYVVEAVDRAATITRQLLNFSRQQPAKKSHQEVNEIVTMTLKMVWPVFGEQIEVEVDLSDEAGIVRADVDIMSQALLNLCINARDAMPSGGRLRITTDQREILDRRGGNASTGQPNLNPGHYSVITVADTGCGMPAKVIDRVFDPFFTTKEVGKGTGMGLAMVFGTPQNHEGAVTVESSEGQGSTFRIWLPVAAQATNDAQQPTKNSGASSLTGSETILLAEDEPMVRDAAVRVLREAGYTVIVAADGEDAVRKFEQNADTIQMAVLDVVMPKLDGPRVYDRMKEANSEIKVVFCTAYNPETAQTDVLEGVQVSTIYKPLAEEALLSTMRRMLDEEPLCQTV
ncbi:MAG: response regulator, partial [Pirellulaceae bacterium]|nr:response regulator [Pirellulaceae bacterium]